MVVWLADVQYSVGELVLSGHFSPERFGTVNILAGLLSNCLSKSWSCTMLHKKLELELEFGGNWVTPPYRRWEAPPEKRWSSKSEQFQTGLEGRNWS